MKDLSVDYEKRIFETIEHEKKFLKKVQKLV